MTAKRRDWYVRNFALYTLVNHLLERRGRQVRGIVDRRHDVWVRESFSFGGEDDEGNEDNSMDEHVESCG